MNGTTLIFDGDDTLWGTHFLYDLAKEKGTSLLNADGIIIDSREFAHIVNRNSIEYAKKHGFDNNRFPTAMTKAYRMICRQQGMKHSETVSKELWTIGANVAEQAPMEFPDARNTLEILSKKYNCVLYTLGDKKQQFFRLNAVSLTPYFQHIFVVLNKTRLALREILTKLNLRPETTWMIGNSASSDIKPALEEGLQCIWLHSEHWLFDEAIIDLSAIYEITSLEEIIQIIEGSCQSPIFYTKDKWTNSRLLNSKLAGR